MIANSVRGKKIDEILLLMASDGASYSVDDVSITLNISYDKCRKIMHFLAKYDFISSRGEDFQINPKIRAFLLNTEEPAIQTVIAS